MRQVWQQAKAKFEEVQAKVNESVNATKERRKEVSKNSMKVVDLLVSKLYRLLKHRY